MALWIKKTTGNTQASWKKPTKIWTKTSVGQTQLNWSLVKKAYVKTSSGWRRFWPSSGTYPAISQDVIISGSINSSTGYLTLTGTNYYWVDADTFQYLFEKSVDSGVTWTTMSTGTATNPSSPSGSNTYSYNVLSSDVTLNKTNIYRFSVKATNTTLNVFSISSSTSNYNLGGPTDATHLSINSFTGNTITIAFDTSTNNNSYLVTASAASPATTVITNTTVSPFQITGLTYGTAYTISVIPYTYGVVFGSPQGYAGSSSTISQTTSPAPAPTQTSRPGNPSGTGVPFSNISVGSGGSYTNSYSKTTRLVWMLAATTPSDGLSSYAQGVLSSPHAVTQNEATPPYQVWWTEDKVIALDAITPYYYYSQGSISSRINSITDSFQRSVASGLGTGSSSYVYSSYKNLDSSFSVNGQAAQNSTTVSSSATGINYPLETINTGYTNINASVDFYTSSGGGNGIAFWVTSAGSWWAVAPIYSFSTSAVTSCSGSTTSYSCPPSTGSNIGDRCGNCTTNTNGGKTCTSTTTTADGTCALNYTQGSNVGDPCSCSDGSRSVSICNGAGSSNRTGCPAGTCNCVKSSLNTGHACTGGGKVLSGTCAGNPAGSLAGDPCGSCTDKSTTNYVCTGTQANYASTQTTVSCNSTNSGTPCSYVGTTGSGDRLRYVYNLCGSTTSNTASWSNSIVDYTYYDYTWNTYTTSSISTYTITKYVAVDTYTYPTNVSVTQYTYSSSLKIYSSSGGSVTSSYTPQILDSTSSTAAYDVGKYIPIKSINISVSNNTITAKGYNSSGVQIGTDLSYTATSPIKTTVDGGSSVGIIKVYSPDNVGIYWDNLNISLS